MKCFKRSFLVVLCCFFSFLFSISSSIPTNAISVNSFGIRSWTTDNGRTWRDLGDSESNAPGYIFNGDYFRGFRLVRYANWGDGDFFSGDVELNLTMAVPKGLGFYTNNRIGGHDFNSAISANTLCGLGAYGAIPAKYQVSDFSATANGISSNDRAEYHSWTIKWKFSGQAREKHTGSYDSYCRLFPSENNSEFFRLFGPNNIGGKMYLEQASTHLAVAVSEDQAAAKYDTMIAQNQTIINNQNFGNQQLMGINDNLIKQQKAQEEQKRKEEEQQNNREKDGKKQADKLGSLFSFTAFNPFSGLFGLFTGGGCKPIPTIGKMLNKPDATYCPWFPGNVRSILTPVLGISSMMLIFGFFVRWLSGSDLDGTIRLRGK